jgi:transcriptional regulator with XRE-family HTH domain/Zn-dependent peptidase ImmA (M78 family)
MIKNERQYRITKAQVEQFRQALGDLIRTPLPEDVHPILRTAQENALRSQLEELEAELMEYEALKSGKATVIEVESFRELPQALIRARIAAGMSQKQLAERLGLKEQQIQQYESTEYAAASITRIQEIIQALGIQIREDIFLPNANVSKENLFSRLRPVGIDSAFIVKRILPSALAVKLQQTSLTEEEEKTTTLKAASVIGRIYNLKLTEVFGNLALELDSRAMGVARFKLPARVDKKVIAAYTTYAYYLGKLALRSTAYLEKKTIPNNPEEIRNTIVSNYGSITFENTLNYVWSLGIPVLPLADVGNFHGAFWRVQGHNVIVLKQRVHFPGRWLNDLLHELGHAKQHPEASELAIIDTEDVLLNTSERAEEEEDAQLFAEEVIFGVDDRVEEITDRCVKQARGSVENLKSVVPQVANKEKVPVDALANYIAYRLSLQNKNWWGAATNLQNKNINSWEIARKVFLEKVDLNVLDEMERALLTQALVDIGG